MKIRIPAVLSVILAGFTCLANSPAPGPLAETGPLMIAKQGNFYVGGREVEVADGTIIADEMFVQFQIPAELKHPYPIVFIHGGMSSGHLWWSRPDGAEGWATRFLRMGYAVYVVDRPTHGRSPHYEAIHGQTFMPPLGMPNAGQNDEPAVEDANSRFPGARRPGDPAFEQSRRGRQSSIEAPFGMADPVAISTRVDLVDQAAGTALLDRIGPAILVTHSRSGTTGWLVADARPHLVKAIVAAEPNGPPFYNAPPLGQPGAPVSRPFGITYAPIAFDPEVGSVEDFGELVQNESTGAGLAGCWVPQGEPRRLVNLQDIPVLVLTGESSYHSGYDHCTAEFLSRAGVQVKALNLGDLGIKGNTHGFMTETNSDEIAGIVADWLERNEL